MADYCGFCDTRRPAGGTNMLVLGSGWFEYCKPCGEKEVLVNAETGEEITLRGLFDRVQAKKENSDGG